MGSVRSAAAIGWDAGKVLLAGAVAMIVVAGCRATSPPQPTVGAMAIAECRDRKDDAHYFPPEALIPREAEDDLTQRRALNRYFTAASLPSLSCGPATSSYRLFWRGAGEAVAVTIIGTDLRAVKFGRTENGELQIVHQQEGAINSADLERLRSLIDSSDYWIMQPFVDLEGDGMIWLFEVRRDDSYKAVTRVQLDGKLAEVASLMVTAMGFEPPPAMRIRNE